MLGGCSAINAMLYIRGNSRDYDQWRDLGNEGWGSAELLEYFKKSEGNQVEHIVEANEGRFHNSKGGLKVNDYKSIESLKYIVQLAAEELEIPEFFDINGPDTIGYGTVHGTLQNGERWSAAKAFLTPARFRPNLRVVKHAFATRVNFEGEKAASVNFEIKGKQFTAKATKEIILSAGAINSPHLLMLSGIGPKEDLQKHNIKLISDLKVGHNLQDHVIVPYCLAFHKSTAKPITIEDLADAVFMYTMHGTGPIGTIPGVNLIGFLNTRNDSRFPDIQLHHLIMNRNTPNAHRFFELIGYPEAILKNLKDTNLEEDFMCVLVTLLNPKSIGLLSLRSSNADEKLKIVSGYLEEQDDVDTIFRAIRSLQRFLGTNSFRNHEGHEMILDVEGCQSFEYDSDEYWECYIRHMSTTLYHPVGTTKMGPDSDPSSVVDSELRVKGVNGLRVIDASIMPNIVSGNTNAPTIMIGEKGADMIMKQWQVEIDEENKL